MSNDLADVRVKMEAMMEAVTEPPPADKTRSLVALVQEWTKIEDQLGAAIALRKQMAGGEEANLPQIVQDLCEAETLSGQYRVRSERVVDYLIKQWCATNHAPPAINRRWVHAKPDGSELNYFGGWPDKTPTLTVAQFGGFDFTWTKDAASGEPITPRGLGWEKIGPARAPGSTMWKRRVQSK